MPRASDVIAQAERWLGTLESPRGSNRVPGVTDWYGMVGPWCAMWVSRVFFDAGLPLPATIAKGFAYTPSGASYFKRLGRWSTSPEIGDVVFFKFPPLDRISHVGIVTGVNSDGSIDTIEGNTDAAGSRTGGQVMRRRRKVGIVGYGRPNYDGTPAPAPPPSSGSTSSSTRLAEDGIFGPATKRRLQESLNRTGAKPRLAVDGNVGPNTIRALQARLNHLVFYGGQGNVAIDGVMRKRTIRALQWVLGVAKDGSFGPVTTRALQRHLNRGEL